MVAKNSEITDEDREKGPPIPPSSLASDTLYSLPEKRIPIVSPDRCDLHCFNAQSSDFIFQVAINGNNTLFIIHIQYLDKVGIIV